MAAGAPRLRITGVVPWAAAAVAAATIAVDVPFIGHWGPEADPLLPLTIACFAVAVAIAPRLLLLRSWAFALAAFGLTLVLRLALAAGGGGIAQWSTMFDLGGFEGPNEYL